LSAITVGRAARDGAKANRSNNKCYLRFGQFRAADTTIVEKHMSASASSILVETWQDCEILRAQHVHETRNSFPLASTVWPTNGSMVFVLEGAADLPKAAL
jgi:hypothetical protein